MKIAIHHRANSFSERWITYCESNKVDYKLVDAYSSDVVQQLEGCDVFMWHHNNDDARDVLFAKELLISIQKKGVITFPDINTNWHFDDKVGQKYLLEAIGAPLITSYVFYNKKDVLDWVNHTNFPKVFKLRGGSGSANVKLVKDIEKAKKLINKAFGRGFSQFDRLTHLKYRINRYKSGLEGVSGVFKGLALLFIGKNYSNNAPKEKGYIYFQDFMPNNNSDIRVIVIGNRAFAIKRMVRENDFRASGSGNIQYDHKKIDKNCIQIAFEINTKIDSQCTAFDFVFDSNGSPKIVEISYGFDAKAYDNCPGYWDNRLNWYEESFNPQEWILLNVIEQATLK